MTSSYQTFDGIEAGDSRQDLQEQQMAKAPWKKILIGVSMLFIAGAALFVLVNNSGSASVDRTAKQMKVLSAAQQQGLTGGCPTSDAFRVLMKFFEGMQDYQREGPPSLPAFGPHLRSLVTSTVKVVDLSDPKRYQESGNYSGLAEFNKWLDKVTVKDSTDVFTNTQTQLDSDQENRTIAGRIKFRDEVVSFESNLTSKELESINFTSSQYTGLAASVKEDDRLESGEFVGRVKFDAAEQSCKIDSITVKRVELSKATQMTPQQFDETDIMNRVAAEVEKHRKIGWMQRARVLHLRDSQVRSNMNLECIKKMERNLALYDGTKEGLDNFEHSKDIKLDFVDVTGQQRHFSGEGWIDYFAGAAGTPEAKQLISLPTEMKGGVVSEAGDNALVFKTRVNDVVIVSSDECRVNHIYLSYDDKMHPKVKDDFFFHILGNTILGLFTPFRLNYAGFSNSGSRQVTHANWMSSLYHHHKHVRLNQLTLPGTHDSGSILPIPASQAQSLSIWNQLLSGVRLFDIRFGWIWGHWHIFHGAVPQLLTLWSVCQDFIRFLNNHPTETIIVNLQTAWNDRWKDVPYPSGIDLLYHDLYGGWDHPSKHRYAKNLEANPEFQTIGGKIVLRCSGSKWGTNKQLENAKAAINALALSDSAYGGGVNAYDYRHKVWQRTHDRCYGVPSLEVSQWNGYCYEFWKCGWSIKGPAEFAQIVNPHMWNNWFGSGPRMCRVGLNSMDFPSGHLIQRIIVVNNLVAWTGISNPTPPPTPAPTRCWWCFIWKPAPPGCFSARAIVSLSNGTQVAMSQIGVGDDLDVPNALGIKGDNRVYFQGHRASAAEKKVYQFIEIQTTRFGKTLSASAGHFIAILDEKRQDCTLDVVEYDRCRKFVRFGEFMRKKDSNEHMHVYVVVNGSVQHDEVELSQTHYVYERGLYNPYTLTGTLQVNDVIVSAHSEFILDDWVPEEYAHVLPPVYQTMFFPFRVLYRVCPSCGVELDARLPLGVGEYGPWHVATTLADIFGRKFAVYAIRMWKANWLDTAFSRMA